MKSRQIQFLSRSPKETAALAKTLLRQFGGFDKPLILALSGNLGAGKTTFVQGLAKSLGVEEKVISPTFIVMKSFLIPGRSRLAKGGKRFFWHIDCWRLARPDFEYLGLKEILKNRENIVCLEWAERVRKMMPQSAVWLKFEHAGGNQRKITVETRLKILAGSKSIRSFGAAG